MEKMGILNMKNISGRSGKNKTLIVQNMNQISFSSLIDWYKISNSIIYTFHYTRGIYIITRNYSFYVWRCLEVLCFISKFDILVCFISAWCCRLNPGPLVFNTKLFVQAPTFKCLNKINTNKTFALRKVCF